MNDLYPILKYSMGELPIVIEEIQKICNLNNKEIFIDLESLEKDCVYPVNTDNFMGFVYSCNEDEQFLIFNDKIFQYAFAEGYNINNVYKFFSKKLFLNLTKQQFIERLLK